MERFLSRVSTKVLAIILGIILTLSAAAVVDGADTISLSVTPGNNSAALSWTPLTGATSYKVRRAPTCSNFTRIATVTSTTFTDTTVLNGSNWCYAITGVLTTGTVVSNKVAVTIGGGGPTPSPSPTPSTSPTPTGSPSASPTPSPTPTPPPAGNVCAGTSIVGYGSGTVGGAGGPVSQVSTVAALRSAIGGTGRRIVTLAPGLYDLGGSDLAISKPNITIHGNGAVIKRGSVKITTNQVIIINLKSRSGDEVPVSANDVDSFTINGNAAAIDHIVLSHVEGLWGPDVSSAMLGRVTDVTIQCSIFGEGLLHSRHTESGDADGHGLAFNVASESATSAAERITFYGDLFTTSQSRQPRIIGAKATDIIDCVFYNYAEGPQGNAQSLNLIGDTWKKGPAPAAAGIPFTSVLWRYTPGGHGAFDTRFDARVFLSGQQVIGFNPSTPSGSDAAVLRSTPLVAPSVNSMGAAQAFSMVATYAGGITADSTTNRLRSNLVNGTGVYFNGVGKPAPNPTW